MGGANYLRTVKLGLKELECQGLVKLVGEFRHLSIVASTKLGGIIQKLISRLIDTVLCRAGLNFPWSASPFAPKVLRWIPDLQDVIHPEFFSDKQISERRKSVLKSLNRGHALYFSSHDAMNTFKTHYGSSDNIVGLIRFNAKLDSSILEEFSLEKNICSECDREGFIYLPNQWWKHKNHELALEAFQRYCENGGRRHLILTGPEHDDRHPEFRDELRIRISKIRGIHSLGLVSRSYQAWLYNQATFLLQPSLFEGWSTTIEEALFMGTPILASDLNVNLEQLDGCDDSVVFLRNSVDDLAKKMELTINRISDSQLQLRRIQRHDRFLADLLDVLVTANAFTGQKQTGRKAL